VSHPLCWHLPFFHTPSHPSLAAILQRVLSASVTVEKELVSSIGKGIVVFAAVAPGDTEKEADSLAAKVIKLKLWDDENGARVFGPAGPSSW
jgi:D-Tyr-tRNAtyr deacylase